MARVLFRFIYKPTTAKRRYETAATLGPLSSRCDPSWISACAIWSTTALCGGGEEDSPRNVICNDQRKDCRVGTPAPDRLPFIYDPLARTLFSLGKIPGYPDLGWLRAHRKCFRDKILGVRDQGTRRKTIPTAVGPDKMNPIR